MANPTISAALPPGAASASNSRLRDLLLVRLAPFRSPGGGFLFNPWDPGPADLINLKAFVIGCWLTGVAGTGAGDSNVMVEMDYGACSCRRASGGT